MHKLDNVERSIETPGGAARHGTQASASPSGKAGREGPVDDHAEIYHLSDEEQNIYFAKYLTSPKLFDLELSDVQFRRKVGCGDGCKVLMGTSAPFRSSHNF